MKLISTYRMLHMPCPTFGFTMVFLAAWAVDSVICTWLCCDDLSLLLYHQLFAGPTVHWCVCRKSRLQLIPVPTPRWPDLLCVYHKTDRLLFTSNMFSAHVAPSVVNTSGESAADVGGWEMYGQDWRHYYDCMLAPVAKQAAGR